MPDKFFEETPEVSEQVVEKIKLGDEEFTQDELQELVGLGKIGREAEQKYKIKIDGVWSKFQKTVNENKELRDRMQAEETAKQRAAEDAKYQAMGQQRQLTEAELRQQAIEQAEQLGIGPKAIEQRVMQTLQANQLLKDAENVIDDMKAEGLPETTVDEILSHMQETGIRNPEKAYKDMFETQWIAKQAEKLGSIKPAGLHTVSSSTAGGKTPTPVKITNDNFDKLFQAALSGEPVI